MSQIQSFGEVHFFGEMDLNLNQSMKTLYKKASEIAEMCGYFADLQTVNGKDQLTLLGEDCHDSLRVENIVIFDQSGKAEKVQKVVYRISYSGEGDDFKETSKKIQVFDYDPKTQDFTETWSDKIKPSVPITVEELKDALDKRSGIIRDDKIIIGLQSVNALCTVFDNLHKEALKERFKRHLKQDPTKLALICWEILNKRH